MGSACAIRPCSWYHLACGISSCVRVYAQRTRIASKGRVLLPYSLIFASLSAYQDSAFTILTTISAVRYAIFYLTPLSVRSVIMNFLDPLPYR